MNLPKEVAIAIGLMMVIGLSMLLGGVFQVWDTREFMVHARVVHGVVVDRSYSVQGHADRGQRLVTPQIQYMDAAGRARMYRPSYRDSFSGYVLGQPVALYVRDASPGSSERVRMIHSGDMWFGSFLLMFIGGAFTATACAICYAAWPIRIRKSVRRKALKPRQPS
jgi:Protein of unknown function (DUF3592)